MIDSVSLLQQVVSAYARGLRARCDPKTSPPAHDRVHISTEGKRRWVLERIASQLVRTPPEEREAPEETPAS